MFQSGMMLVGSTLNALGIAVGGILGLALSRQFSPSSQLAWRGIMGIVTVITGLWIAWTGLNGTASHIFKNLAIAILALTLGRLTGRLLHIQKAFNRLGQYARNRITSAKPDSPNRFNDGFVVCTLLFCAGPLGPVGAVQDGVTGTWQPLAIKMVMDGLAAMGFVTIFGWGVILSALPVYVFQGTLTLGAAMLAPMLRDHQLVDSVNAVSGLLVFCVALIVMDLKKFELADYLPSLAVAPVIAWFWR